MSQHRFWLDNTDNIDPPPGDEKGLHSQRQGVVVDLFALSEVVGMAASHPEAQGLFKDQFELICDLEDEAWEVRRKAFDDLQN